MENNGYANANEAVEETLVEISDVLNDMDNILRVSTEAETVATLKELAAYATDTINEDPMEEIKGHLKQLAISLDAIADYVTNGEDPMFIMENVDFVVEQISDYLTDLH